MEKIDQLVLATALFK